MKTMNPAKISPLDSMSANLKKRLAEEAKELYCLNI